MMRRSPNSNRVELDKRQRREFKLRVTANLNFKRKSLNQSFDQQKIAYSNERLLTSLIILLNYNSNAFIL